MQATRDDLKALLELQQIDIEIINTEKHLSELPQREELAALAEKKKAIVEKLAQVSKMHDSVSRKLIQLEDEQAILTRKRNDTQERIDAAKGDFRAVQSLTRDLNGLAKRLETLEEEQLEAAERSEQVEAVKAQIESATKALDVKAHEIRDSFQQDSAALNATLEQKRQKSAEISANIDPALLKAYREAVRHGGGIGMAQLAENRCGTCRNVIDANRLLQIRREAPLSRCPNCGRLLIVSAE